MLKDPDSKVRREALDKLNPKLAAHEAGLVRLLEDPDAGMRIAALLKLGELEPAALRAHYGAIAALRENDPYKYQDVEYVQDPDPDPHSDGYVQEFYDVWPVRDTARDLLKKKLGW